MDNENYVTRMGSKFTVLIEMYSVASSNLKPCVLNVKVLLSETVRKESV